jgi:hypothetical protein
MPMHAHEHDGDLDTLHPRAARPDPERHAHALDAVPPIASGSQSPNSVLRLQRLAGNRATASMLAQPTVQRCGPTPCDCGPEERAGKEASMLSSAPTHDHDGAADTAAQ